MIIEFIELIANREVSLAKCHVAEMLGPVAPNDAAPTTHAWGPPLVSPATAGLSTPSPESLAAAATKGSTRRAASPADDANASASCSTRHELPARSTRLAARRARPCVRGLDPLSGDPIDPGAAPLRPLVAPIGRIVIHDDPPTVGTAETLHGRGRRRRRELGRATVEIQLDHRARAGTAWLKQKNDASVTAASVMYGISSGSWTNSVLGASPTRALRTSCCPASSTTQYIRSATTDTSVMSPNSDSTTPCCHRQGQSERGRPPHRTARAPSTPSRPRPRARASNRRRALRRRHRAWESAESTLLLLEGAVEDVRQGQVDVRVVQRDRLGRREVGPAFIRDQFDRTSRLGHASNGERASRRSGAPVDEVFIHGEQRDRRSGERAE